MLLIFKDNSLTCDQYCDKTYRGREHADTHEVGAWFCRGLWKHYSKFHGGCHYWRKAGAVSIEGCKAQCRESGMSGVVVSLNGARSVTEIESCIDGCAKGGKI